MTDAKKLPRISDFDDTQRGIIEAPAQRRLVVTAGPGTGKTAVACARVASLAASGVSSANILMVSFTRTAVAELRSRISAALGKGAGVQAVRIATLDSEAWRLRYGFTEEEVARFGGHEANIDAVLKMLGRPTDELLDYFERFHHVIIDEAQDLTEQRANFVLKLLSLLDPSCGFTIFGDPAQAIYGFTASDDGDATGSRKATNLLESISRDARIRVHRASLERVYRAGSDGILELFRAARTAVVSPDLGGPARHQAVLDVVFGLARPKTPELEDEILFGDPDDASDLLWLVRQRREVLEASSELARRGRPHRVRVPDLPIWLEPWIGAVLARCVDKVLTRSAYDQHLQVAKSLPDDPEQAWNALLAIAGNRDGTVETGRLRKDLSQARHDHRFARPEFGARRGPIVGTVHASKGREAPRVLLAVRRSAGTGSLEDEEARVVYVGATRAHREVYVDEAAFRLTRRLRERGRVYSPARRSALVELGLANDLELTAPVSRRFHREANDAHQLQDYLASVPDAPSEVAFILERAEGQWRNVAVSLVGARPIRLGVLSQAAASDLFGIAREIGAGGAKPPQVIADLHLFGARTIVLPPDFPRADLYEPWATSGVFLAPVLHGFPRVAYNARPGGRDGG